MANWAQIHKQNLAAIVCGGPSARPHFTGKPQTALSSPLHRAPASSVDPCKRVPRMVLRPLGRRLSASSRRCAASYSSAASRAIGVAAVLTNELFAWDWTNQGRRLHLRLDLAAPCCRGRLRSASWSCDARSSPGWPRPVRPLASP